jgi:hypothetical protein
MAWCYFIKHKENFTFTLTYSCEQLQWKIDGDSFKDKFKFLY